MAVLIEVRGFSGPYAGLNALPADYAIGMSEVVNRALTVGGRVVGSAAERTRRRSSIANMVLSSIRAVGPPSILSPLAVTGLYVNTETTEKTGISFRLGMAFAAVAAARVVGVPALKHVVPGAASNGRRADLVGLDGTGGRHVVEAKARSYGFSTPVVTDAKTQATSTATQLAGLGRGAATASASVTDLSTSPIRILLEDPPAEPPYHEDPDDERERRFVNDFYSPVRDLLEVREPAPSGNDAVDQIATGGWLLGSEVWLGLRNDAASQLADGEPVLRTGVPHRLASIHRPLGLGLSGGG